MLKMAITSILTGLPCAAPFLYIACKTKYYAASKTADYRQGTRGILQSLHTGEGTTASYKRLGEKRAGWQRFRCGTGTRFEPSTLDRLVQGGPFGSPRRIRRS